MTWRMEQPGRVSTASGSTKHNSEVSCAIFSSVQSLGRLGRRGDTRDDSAEILFQPFQQKAFVSSSGYGQGCTFFDVVHPAFPLPTTASPTLQCALKDGFGEAVTACGMLEPCKFLSLDSCSKRFLWTHKEVDLAPHPVVGLVLQVGDEKKFPQAHGFKSLDPVF